MPPFDRAPQAFVGSFSPARPLHARSTSANVVRHQNGAVGAEGYPYRPSIESELVRGKEPGQDIRGEPAGQPVVNGANTTL